MFSLIRGVGRPFLVIKNDRDLGIVCVIMTSFLGRWWGLTIARRWPGGGAEPRGGRGNRNQCNAQEIGTIAYSATHNRLSRYYSRLPGSSECQYGLEYSVVHDGTIDKIRLCTVP
jgi:hypothetical protein